MDNKTKEILFKNGYYEGETCDLYRQPNIPSDLNEDEKIVWMSGFDCGVEDRLS